MIRRAVVLVALAAALVPAPPAAAEELPVATVGAPIPVEAEPASLLRPATMRAVFRVPRADTALYIGTPSYVRDLSITLVGPGPRRATLVAAPDLPGRMLGLRLPDDAADADRIELQATTVSAATPPYLLPAERLATIGWSRWWLQALFGLFGALALLSALLGLVLRARAFAWCSALAAANAGLMLPWLGIVRPPPETSELLHAALQSLAYAALAALTLAFFRTVRLPRAVTRTLWALVALNAGVVAGGDVLQDLWPLPDALAQALAFALDGAFVGFGILALRRNAAGARWYLLATALAALGFLAANVPLLDASLAQATPQLGIALETLLLFVTLTVKLAQRNESAPVAAAAPLPPRAAVLGPPPPNADGLTGIPNRIALDDALARAWNHARRTAEPLAALLLDVDHFKKYNEEYGHLAGDDALRRVAAALAQTTARRHGDLAGRYGGEEFLVLLPDTPLPEAVQLARELQRSIEQLDIAHGSAPARRLTVSTGVAAFVPQHDGDGGELIRRAGNALYLAKTMGRNRVVADESPAPQPALT
ncbi:MAG: GGDEF domain-containing protein [Candidatus Eremiobacteraeota bacterium]|nr:GGDEF domain-containing protein [Candidatus Eremiobacteraeota bacterium]